MGLGDDWYVVGEEPLDDDVDALSQGIRWLRDTGWALRRDERDRDLASQADLDNLPNKEPIYDL